MCLQFARHIAFNFQSAFYIMKKKLTLLISFIFIAANMVLAQSTIKGKVTDKAGQALIGVSVKVQGTSTGSVTDVNGNYSLNAQPNATLIATYVGYANQSVGVGGQSVVNITMTEETTNLNDVVVVGFGTQKKSVVTGAISRVRGSDIQDQQVVRVDQALQGRTSGVTVVSSSGAPGSAPIVRVRGVTSRVQADPLYVVDGVVLNGGIETVNPADIESMEVLKDASAAIYGSRSSNGVILVTTKKGKNGAPQVSYSGYVGIQSPVKKVELANATQYATLRNQAFANDGKTTPMFANPQSYGTGTNWQDQIFSNNALIHNHNLSVSGGSDKSTYYTSIGYLEQQGIIFKDLSNYKRLNVAANSTSKVKKWLTFGENLSYSYQKNVSNFNTNSEFGGPLSSALNLDPITPVVVDNISAQSNASTYTAQSQYLIRDELGRPYGLSPYVQNEMSNPLAFRQTVQGNYGWSHNLLGNAYLEIEPITGLKIRSTVSGKQSFWGNESFTPLYYLTPNANNVSQTSANRGSNRNFTYNIDNIASYNRAIGLHNFTALIGTSAQKLSETGLNGTYNGLPVFNYQQSSFNWSLPAANRVAGGYEAQPYTIASYFARAIYNYDEKYLFTGIIRRDGSSKFGSNNVWGTFPSAQVGWVVTREKFFPQNTFVDFLKLRGSYGITGNEMALSPFQYTSTVSGGRNYVLGDQLVIGNAPNAPGNPDLRWEETRQADIGLEAVIFHDFNLTLDLYSKQTKGMLQQVQLPSYGGYSGQPFYNIGDMTNKGIELELGYRKKIGDFNFNASGNIAYNHNKVTSLGTSVFATEYYTDGNVQSTSYEIGRTQVGQPVGAFYGFNNLGIFQSQNEIANYKSSNGTVIQPNAKPGDFKWEDINNDGKIGQEDRKFLGSRLPSWTYGFTFNSSYKAFDLKIFGQGVWGNKIYQAYRRLDLPNANYPIAALNAWTPSNPSTTYPRLTDNDPNNNFKYPSNFYLQNGAYFRIKTLQIGYTIPKSVLQKVDINRLRIYVSSNNLATVTGYKGYDPEISGGIDRGIYPQARTFMFGLDLTL
jgi:TonB-linked SusC/RagA family outer membrane protein